MDPTSTATLGFASAGAFVFLFALWQERHWRKMGYIGRDQRRDPTSTPAE